MTEQEHAATGKAGGTVEHKPGTPTKKPGQQFNAGAPHLFVPGQDGKCALCGGQPGGSHQAADGEQAAAKKAHHRFVGAAHLRRDVVSTVGYFGGCYACGLPASAHPAPVTQTPPAAAPTGTADGSAPTQQQAAKTDGPHGQADCADPGYQKDGKKRYPVSNAGQVRSAWSYINQSGNARAYTPAQREKIKARIKTAAKKYGVNIENEQAAAMQRLQRNYGPQLAPVSSPTDTPAGPTTGPSPKEVEDQLIADNARTPQAQGPHPFMVAEFPDDNGDPRCRLCGEGTDPHAVFEPKVPVSAAEIEPSSTSLTWNGGITNGVPTITTSTWTTAPRADAPATPVLAEGALLLPPETSKAFATEVNGHTLITAPANVFTREVEKAAAANEHFLWMQGRFVGAEKANRNGAFWSTGDLELGELTVRNGPLNWLHEARHVIGTIAQTQMVKRDEQTASDLDQPYIEAASAIWRWIYPDEAWVVEQASDAGKLWYSMECVSKEVACVGVAGCGGRASYGEYLKGEGGTCEHMRQKSAVRHFSDPTFLGGAVIVPPVRPGWADADASVIRQAASLAEGTYEQAGRPDVPATEWEQIMAQLVAYASR